MAMANFFTVVTSECGGFLLDVQRSSAVSPKITSEPSQPLRFPNMLFSARGLSHRHCFTAGKGIEKDPAIAFGFHPAVEDDDDAGIGLRANEPAEALFQLNDRFGDGVFHEGVSAGALDRFQPRFG